MALVYIMIWPYSAQLTLSNANILRPTRLESIGSTNLLPPVNVTSLNLVIF